MDRLSEPTRDAIRLIQKVDREIERLEAELAILRAHRQRHVYDVEKGAEADSRAPWLRK